MKNKLTKLLITSTALLAGVAALTGCDDIEAQPVGYDEIKLIKEDGDLTNNQLQVIYDALVSAGSSNSEKVMNNLLKIISKTTFGSFYEEKYGDDKVVGLIDVEDPTNMTAFLSDAKYGHKIYNTGFDGQDATNASKRVLAYRNYLLEQINKEFISIAKNSSYQDDQNNFKEEEWFRATKNNGYDLKIAAGASFKKETVNGNDDEEDVSVYFHAGYLVDYADYIERSILPSLYQKQLVEYYIMNKNSSILGRSYARKVEYIKVADNSEYPGKMKALVLAYAKNVLDNATNAAKAEYGFDFLSDLVKGTVASGDAVATSIYADAGFDTAITQNGGSYTAHPETTLGGYIKQYNKITSDRFTNDMDAYNDFTGTGAHTKEVGFEQHVNKLVATGSTAEDGWYTSNTLSGIPSELKDRVFKMSIASEILSTATSRTYTKAVNGSYYVVPSTTEWDNKYPYVYHEDGATYIVKVTEAVNVPKLNSAANGNDESYDAIHSNDSFYREQIAYEISHLVSDNDTYQKKANQYFLEKANISFHDDYVYDYFAEQYPDLWDIDED